MRPSTTLVMLFSFAITALEVHALNLEYDPSLFTRGGSRGTTAKPEPKSKDVAQAPKVPLPDSRSKSRLKSSSIFEEDIVGHELPLPGPKSRAPALPASNKAHAPRPEPPQRKGTIRRRTMRGMTGARGRRS